MGILIILALLKPLMEKHEQIATSDAGRATKGTISIAMDSWIGYFPLCSPDLRDRMLRAGYALKCVDDRAAYAERMKKLSDGSVDLAVFTVDADILNGRVLNFPASIVSIIDESYGGDALLIRKDRAANLDELKRRKNLKVAFTPNSPSEHLIKIVVDHFDIDAFRRPWEDWRVETAGSAEALEKLLAGTVDAAVVWEPDVTKALAAGGITVGISSKDMRRLIVDVLLVNRKFLKDHPDVIQILVGNYFRTLKHYSDDHDALLRDVAIYTKSQFSREQIEAMLGGVTWVNLHDNATRWFGVGMPGEATSQWVYDTIEATVKILVGSGDFNGNPLPDEDPARLVYSGIIAKLYVEGSSSGFGGDSVVNNTLATVGSSFAPLSDEEWSKLQPVGTLKVAPVSFSSGSSRLDLESKEIIDRVAETISHYPRFRIIIEGHTSLRGNPEANKALSQQRANAVAKYLEVTHQIDPNRMRAIGMGSSSPLPRDQNESDQSYNYRLPRVEFHFVQEVM